MVAVVMLVLTVEAVRHFIGVRSPALQVAVVASLALLTCFGLLLREPPQTQAARPTGEHATIGE
jgi:hypothetical protein